MNFTSYEIMSLVGMFPHTDINGVRDRKFTDQGGHGELFRVIPILGA